MRAARLVVVTGIVLTGLVAPEVGAAADTGDAAAQVKEICQTLARADDDVGYLRTSLFVRIIKLEEPGRVALLDIAGSKRPEAMCALNFLVELGEERAVPVVRKILNRRRTPRDLEIAAIAAAAAFKDVDSIDKIAEAFKSKDEDIVRAATYALGSLPDARGLRILNAALIDPRYPPPVHFDILTAVGTTGNEAAIPLLEQLLADAIAKRDEFRRGEVIVSLAGIGPRARSLAIRDLEELTNGVNRRRAAREMVAVWRRQQGQTTDAAERAELDRAIQTVQPYLADQVPQPPKIEPFR
jgi:HEAT repeat protein